MIKTRIKITGMDMTPSIQDYVDKKIDMLNKFIDSEDDALAEIEIGRTTNHHHKGDVYKAELHITTSKGSYHAEAKESDLYIAIDMVKDKMSQEIVNKKDRKVSLMKKGQKKIKDALKKGKKIV